MGLFGLLAAVASAVVETIEVSISALSSYDSLIVAAALDAGCKTLYSEDLQHGQQIEGVTVTNPFRT